MDDVQFDLADYLWGVADRLDEPISGITHPSARADMIRLSAVVRRIGDCVMEGLIDGPNAQELADAVAALDLPESNFPMIGGK